MKEPDHDDASPTPYSPDCSFGHPIAIDGADSTPPAQARQGSPRLARWMGRLKRAFHFVQKHQQRITRFERQITKLEGA